MKHVATILSVAPLGETAVIKSHSDSRLLTGTKLYTVDSDTDRLGMVKGIVLAVADSLRLSRPEELISAAGITDEELELCSDYDLAALREAGITDVESDL